MKGQGSHAADNKLNCISYGSSDAIRRISQSGKSNHDLMIRCLDDGSRNRDDGKDEFCHLELSRSI